MLQLRQVIDYTFAAGFIFLSSNESACSLNVIDNGRDSQLTYNADRLAIQSSLMIIGCQNSELFAAILMYFRLNEFHCNCKPSTATSHGNRLELYAMFCNI